MINDNIISDDDVPDIVPKRRGRKKGVKLDLLSLRPGGTGGNCAMSKREMDTRWQLDKGSEASLVDCFEDSNSAYSSASSSKSDASEDDDLLEYDILEDACVTDMRGCRILRMESLAKTIQQKMRCKKCALSGHTDYINEFINFTVEYEAKLEKDERELLFGSRMDRMEWKLENWRLSLIHISEPTRLV